MLLNHSANGIGCWEWEPCAALAVVLSQALLKPMAWSRQHRSAAGQLLKGAPHKDEMPGEPQGHGLFWSCAIADALLLSSSLLSCRKGNPLSLMASRNCAAPLEPYRRSSPSCPYCFAPWVMLCPVSTAAHVFSS